MQSLSTHGADRRSPDKPPPMSLSRLLLKMGMLVPTLLLHLYSRDCYFARKHITNHIVSATLVLGGVNTARERKLRKGRASDRPPFQATG
mmetsp:Transcript_87744/g.174156  ORF Transcript_87744/g.174156 Transcript_87744/m.174156 type:complete len:90 (-) Transcript_87744:1343-1612(-)